MRGQIRPNKRQPETRALRRAFLISESNHRASLPPEYSEFDIRRLAMHSTRSIIYLPKMKEFAMDNSTNGWDIWYSRLEPEWS